MARAATCPTAPHLGLRPTGTHLYTNTQPKNPGRALKLFPTLVNPQATLCASRYEPTSAAERRTRAGVMIAPNATDSEPEPKPFARRI